MTNREIVEHLGALHAMQEREKESSTAKLAVKVGFAVRKNINILEQAYKPYIESLQEIQGEFLDGDRDKLKFENNTDKERYLKEVNGLLEIDNADLTIHKISLDALAECKELTMEDQEALFFMVQE